MILVTGTGRSGTSTVARILHERMGVAMGFRFDPPSDDSPHGDYEDLDFKEINRALLQGEESYPVWLAQTRRLIGRREQQHPGATWGLKDPRCCHFLNEYVIMANPVVILCRRDRGMVVDSMMRCYGWTTEQAGQLHDERIRLLEAVAERTPVYWIDFTARIPEQQVESRLWEVIIHEAESRPHLRQALQKAERPRRLA